MKNRWRQMANVFREKINLGASRFTVRPDTACFTFARHSTVVSCLGHGLQHLRVKVIGKYAIESQVVEWSVISVCVLN
jgi:hypothetical protein